MSEKIGLIPKTTGSDETNLWRRLQYLGVSFRKNNSNTTPLIWRVLAKCHEVRNLGEYEGDLNVDERLVTDLIAACKAVAAALEKLAPPA